MARGKAEKQPFKMHLSLRQHLFSVQRYSSNTGQVQNMSTLLEVTVVATLYSMILKVFSGCLLAVITVMTPTPVTISTVMSLASISLVPNLDSRVAVLTGRKASIIEGEPTGRYLAIESHMNG